MALDAELREAVPASEAVASGDPERPTVKVRAAAILDVMRHLRERAGEPFDVLIDLTAVDREAERGAIEVVYQLRSLASKRRCTVKAEVTAAEPVLPSVASVWKSANWAERECYDMFGVRFDGHPDLRRILMYEEFVGYPLRKSYPYQKRQPLTEERDPIANPWPAKDLEPR